MGARANFVLIDRDGWRLHYSHWAADTIASVLVAGPEATGRFIDAQRLCDPVHEWLDDAWAEGGAVLDLVDRQLVYYGDQLLWNVERKQVFAALLARTWPGWRLRWAYDGIGDLAAAVGVDRAHVRFLAGSRLVDTAVLDEFEYVQHLLTVESVAGLCVYPLSETDHTAWHGPTLLDLLPAGDVADLELCRTPTGGLHVNTVTRTIGVWIGFTEPGLLSALHELWPGWRIEFWEDRYQEQLARCGGAVRIEIPDPIETLDTVLEWLRKRLGHNPVESMLDRVTELYSDSEVRLNPHFTEHEPVDPADEEWSRVLCAAADLRAELTPGH